MRMYRNGWCASGSALLVVGLLVALGAAAPGSLGALLIGFVVAAVACSLVSVSPVGAPGIAGRHRMRARLVTANALVAGAVAVVLLTFAGFLGQGVELLACIVLLGSPAAVRVYGRCLRSVPTPSPTQLDAIARAFVNAGVGYVGVPPEFGPRELTDVELSQRWHASGVHLLQHPSTAQVLRSVQQRQIYLDEFERRHPQRFAAWLASGAGALDDLAPDPAPGHVDHVTINWDELTRGRD